MAQKHKLVYAEWSILATVCALLDLEVRSDLFDDGLCVWVGDGYKCQPCNLQFADDDEAAAHQDTHEVEKYFLHECDDPSVGMRGADFSPAFEQLHELDSWVQARLDYIRFMAEYISHTDNREQINYEAWWSAYECVKSPTGPLCEVREHLLQRDKA